MSENIIFVLEVKGQLNLCYSKGRKVKAYATRGMAEAMSRFHGGEVVEYVRKN